MCAKFCRKLLIPSTISEHERKGFSCLGRELRRHRHLEVRKYFHHRPVINLKG